ncbi:MAG: S41 family peptidase [Pyrinomonadaceae bacterium]|jgi:C-terminal processing protease CtpA/Prc|nr:S41 family peptidase [Pyrinomonadaceae bacterium]
MKNFNHKSFILSVVLALLFHLSSTAQISDSLKLYLDGAIAHAQTNSLYRQKIDWNAVKTEMYLQAKDAKNVKDLAPALKYLLSKLEDSHGKFLYKNQMLAYWFGEPKEHQKKIDSKIWSEIQSGKYTFKSELIEKKIGYLRIPGLPMGDNVKMSEAIRNKVCELKDKKAKYWIVDLRYNGGGNMYPMMEGLGNLIGDGIVGKVSDFEGKILSTWTIKDADFYYDDYLAADLPNTCKIKKMPKIAVLISQYTASSGEAVAVAFKGRPNTKIFGLKTAGLITVTDWTPINTDLFASISVAFYADRNNKIYREYIEPDEFSEFILTDDFKRDETLQKAIQWLKK